MIYCFPLILAACVISFLAGVGAGGASSDEQIAEDCEQMHFTRIDERVYRCELIPEPPK